jgi:hypothetical protein
MFLRQECFATEFTGWFFIYITTLLSVALVIWPFVNDKTIVVYVKEISQHLSEVMEDNHGHLQIKYSVCDPSFRQVKQVWDVIYICKDNHLSNCSIIFITIAQYTQMYWNNRTALAEDDTTTPWTLYWSATRKLGTLCWMYFLISLSRTHRRRVTVGIVDGIA